MTGSTEKSAMEQILGAGMDGVKEQIRKYANSESAVLILGETGTGKELVARALWEAQGGRGSFIVIDCGSVAAGIAETELFGCRKGAHDKADADRPGPFEAAGDGVVFLDEIEDLPTSIQTKLLRALDGKTVTRVGETASRKIKARFIAATNRDIKELIRVDLVYRLKLQIRVPPLCDRIQDIDALVEGILRRERWPMSLPTDSLKAYSWPGNVRELESVLENLYLEAKEGVTITEASVKSKLGVERDTFIKDAAQILLQVYGNADTPVEFKTLKMAWAKAKLFTSYRTLTNAQGERKESQGDAKALRSNLNAIAVTDRWVWATALAALLGQAREAEPLLRLLRRLDSTLRTAGCTTPALFLPPIPTRSTEAGRPIDYVDRDWIEDCPDGAPTFDWNQIRAAGAEGKFLLVAPPRIGKSATAKWLATQGTLVELSTLPLLAGEADPSETGKQAAGTGPLVLDALDESAWDDGSVSDLAKKAVAAKRVVVVTTRPRPDIDSLTSTSTFLGLEGWRVLRPVPFDVDQQRKLIDSAWRGHEKLGSIREHLGRLRSSKSPLKERLHEPSWLLLIGRALEGSNGGLDIAGLYASLSKAVTDETLRNAMPALALVVLESGARTFDAARLGSLHRRAALITELGVAAKDLPAAMKDARLLHGDGSYALRELPVWEYFAARQLHDLAVAANFAGVDLGAPGLEVPVEMAARMLKDVEPDAYAQLIIKVADTVKGVKGAPPPRHAIRLSSTLRKEAPDIAKRPKVLEALDGAHERTCDAYWDLTVMASEWHKAGLAELQADIDKVRAFVSDESKAKKRGETLCNLLKAESVNLDRLRETPLFKRWTAAERTAYLCQQLRVRLAVAESETDDNADPQRATALQTTATLLLDTRKVALDLKWRSRIESKRRSEKLGAEEGGHRGAAFMAAMHSDGWLITAGTDIRTWSKPPTRVGRAPDVERQHSGEVWGLAVSGDVMVSASDECVAKSWKIDPTTGHFSCLREVRHGAWANACALRPDGQMAVSGGDDGRLLVWNPQAEHPSRDFLAHEGWVLTMAANDEVLATGSQDGRLLLWRWRDLGGEGGADPRPFRTLRHPSWVRGVCWLKDGRLVTGCRDGGVRVWPSAPGSDAVLMRHRASVRGVAAVEYGDKILIAAGDDDGTIRVWTDSGEPVTVLAGHRDMVHDLRAHEQTLYSASADGTVGVWDLRGELSDSGRITRILTRDDKAAAVIDRKRVLWLDCGTGAPRGEGFEVDGEPLFLPPSIEGVLGVDASGQMTATFPISVRIGEVLAVGADGERYVTLGKSGQVVEYGATSEAAPGAARSSLPGRVSAGGSVVVKGTLSSDGRLAAVAMNGGHVVCWDTRANATGRWEFEAGDKQPVLALAVRASVEKDDRLGGQLLIAQGNTLRIEDLSRSVQFTRIDLPGDVTCAAWVEQSDGPRLLVADDSRAIWGFAIVTKSAEPPAQLPTAADRQNALPIGRVDTQITQ